MIKILSYFLGVSVFLFPFNSNAQIEKKVLTANSKLLIENVVDKILHKGLNTVDLGLYPGTLLLHGMGEYAVVKKDQKLLGQTVDYFLKFKSKKIEGRGSFYSYQAGGSGAAYIDYLGKSELLSEQVLQYANKMFKEQKRSSEGILTAHWAKDSLDQVFIDIAFAVTPYLLYTGLKYKKAEFVDAAVFETLALFKILKDSNGLLHQARGFSGYEVISDDNWSRGNGWGAYALATLVRDLPANHPRKNEVLKVAKSFFLTLLKYQNSEGLWNQEMSDSTSYVETSGSGLMLYAIGIGIEKDLIDKSNFSKFKKGIRGYLSYIAEDGSISHTCQGCLSPGLGLKKDYINRSWIYNDHHAFGPAVLAFSQALKLKIKKVIPENPVGIYAANPDSTSKPKTYLVYLPEFNQNIAWENDRIAFRIYGPKVNDRVSSGIDIWAKSVNYPIIDKWFKLSLENKPYHIDRGEGCDFFNVGFSRGLGGTAIWKNEKPYISKTYSSFHFIKNTDEEIVFELTFDPWDAGGIIVSEKKVVSMKMGTNFFKVASTFYTESNEPFTAAIGIAYANKVENLSELSKGVLNLWESYLPDNGMLGTAILVDPRRLSSFNAYQKEQFALINGRSGEPITYFVGAGWSKSNTINSKEEWLRNVNYELQLIKFN